MYNDCDYNLKISINEWEYRTRNIHPPKKNNAQSMSLLLFEWRFMYPELYSELSWEERAN